MKILIILIILIFCNTVSAQNYKISDEVSAFAVKLNDFLVNCQFDSAYAFCDKLLKKDPNEPLFYYLYLASIGLKTLDFDEIKDKEKFNAIYAKGIERINVMLKTEPDNCELLLVNGFLISANASFLLVCGKYASGVGAGGKALDVLKAALVCCDENYDALYYLGFYNYARAELRKRLGVLFWLPKSSDDGIAALQKCVENAKFMNRAAEMVLADVFVRENKLEKTKDILPKLLEKYPESRFLLWTKMRYEFAKKDNSAAINTAVFVSRSYFRDSAFHNGIMILEEARKIAGLRKFPKEVRAEIAELEKKIDKSKVSNSDMKKFFLLVKE
jgi:tetratricopeptide (TPR) repeat protein